MMKIGIGYDVHRLVPNRKLVIGGVEIPFNLGLDGHSDADVLIHAVMDSVIGAMGLGDIGVLFPDTDNKYKDISSVQLLKEVARLMQSKGYAVSNIDAVVIAQRPKLRSFIGGMENIMAAALCTDTDNINVKATTEEGLGFTGKGEGIAAKAVCLLKGLFE